MRTFYHKMSVLLVATLGVWLSACVDDGYDLKNIDSAMQWNGSLGIPVLAEDRITLEDMLNQFGNAVPKQLVLEDGVLCLLFEKQLSYGVSDINKNFKDFDNLVKDLVLLDEATADDFEETSGFYLTTVDCNLFDKVNGGANAGKHRINRIEFKNTNIMLNLEIEDITFSSFELQIDLPQSNGLPPQSLIFDIPAGGDNILLTEQNITIDLEALKAAGDKLKITISGYDVNLGLAPKITIKNLSFDPEIGEFIAWGWFNYTVDALLNEEFKIADIPVKILQDMDFKFNLTNTRFEFNIASSFGTPLSFNLREFNAVHENEGANALPVDKEFSIARANNLGETVQNDLIKLDKSDVLEIGELVSSELRQVMARYSIGTKQINPQSPGDVAEQFISSKNDVSVHAKMIAPLSLEKGDHLIYNHSVAVLLPEEVKSSLEAFEVEKATIFFAYNNALPLSLTAWFAKNVNGNMVPISTVPDVQVDLSYQQLGEFKIEIDQHRLDDLLKMDGLIMEYKLRELPDAITIEAADAVQLKIGVQLKKFTYKPNK